MHYMSKHAIYRTRSFYTWLNTVFNKYQHICMWDSLIAFSSSIDVQIHGILAGLSLSRVDHSRIKEVGPDRAAAEWLLKCGASVKWKNKDNWVSDYNDLQTQTFKNVIEEIDATESCIMHVGFPYLSGLNYLKRIKFCRCMYLENTCMNMLSTTKNSLISLDVISCGNISDEGILAISNLKKLKSLYLYDLPEVKDMKSCINELQKNLEECEIIFKAYN